MNNSAVEILRILTDKLSNCSSGLSDRVEFYKTQIAKVVDAYCKGE